MKTILQNACQRWINNVNDTDKTIHGRTHVLILALTDKTIE